MRDGFWDGFMFGVSVVLLTLLALACAAEEAATAAPVAPVVGCNCRCSGAEGSLVASVGSPRRVEYGCEVSGTIQGNHGPAVCLSSICPGGSACYWARP